MSRHLVPVATIATIAAIAWAAEMQSPGFWALIFAGVLHGIGMALESYVTVAVIAVILISVGYIACLAKNAPAIRAAGVERRHEKRIDSLRAENVRLVGVAKELRDGRRWN